MPSNNRFRSLKAALYGLYTDSRNMFEIIIGIMAGTILLQIALAVFINDGRGISNGSALNTSFSVAIWAVPISMIAITSNSELLKKFSFPVDRNTLALSHILYILAAPLGILLPSCGLYLLEYLLYSLLETRIPGFVYLWMTTKSTFLTGFFVSYCIIVLLASVTYFLFMYFFRYKLATSVIAGLSILLILTFSPLRSLVVTQVFSVLRNDNPWILCPVYLALSAVLWGLAFIPLKRMEVKK